MSGRERMTLSELFNENMAISHAIESLPSPKTGTQIKIRLPADYTVTDGPPLRSPNFASSDKVKQNQILARFMVGK